MTRDQPYTSELDGSRVSAAWSNCQVRPIQNQKWRIAASNVMADLPLVVSNGAGESRNVTLLRGDTAAQIRTKLIGTGLLTNATVSAGLPSAAPVNATIEVEILATANRRILFAPQGALAAGYTLTETQVGGGAFRTWVESDVNQDRTGYDAPRTGNLAYDKRYRGVPVPHQSQTIVEFNTNPATPNFAFNDLWRSRLPGGTPDSRYAAESVTINLGTLTRPTGSAVR